MTQPQTDRPTSQQNVRAFIQDRAARRRGNMASWMLILLVTASLVYLSTDAANERILRLPSSAAAAAAAPRPPLSYQLPQI